MRKLQGSPQYSEGRSTTWSGSRLINCFAEAADGDKREAFALLASPGLTLWATLGTEPVRGAHTCSNVLYVVAGTVLYSVTNAGVSVAVGNIPGTDRVRMAANNAELAIAANGVGYVYSTGTVHTPLLFNVSDVTYVDGYFIWVVQNSDQFFISALDDGLTYDAADIATVEGAPDVVIGVETSHRQVLFPGADTLEVFYNSGASDFPFERQGAAFIERGCFDRDSIVRIDNSVNFLGNDRTVYSLDAYRPVRISTHAIEYQLRNVTYAQGFTYDQEGHKFYCLRTDNGTFCFDHATRLWHERVSDGLTNWRIGTGCNAYGLSVLGSSETGKLYLPDLDVFDEDGEAINFEIYLPTITAERERLTMYAFELLCETGVGNGAVANPQVMLTYSDDGGATWSDEMWRSILGAVGAHRARAIWRKLGRFRNRQMRIKITDSVRRLVISCWADMR